MKKSLLLSVMMVLWAVTSYAFIGNQNLVVNGDFSVDNFDAYSKAESCVLNTTDYHSAPASCQQTGGTKDIAQSIPVTGGLSYKISFWYKVTTKGDGEDVRIWSYFAGGDMTSEVEAKLKGPNNVYLPNVTEWAKYEVVVQAQAEATSLNFELRTYSGAVVLWDDLSVIEEDVNPADAMPKVMDVMPASGSSYLENEEFTVSAVVTTTDPAGIDTVVLATGAASDALTDTVAMPGADGNYSTKMSIDEAGKYFGQVIAIGANGKVTKSSTIEVNIAAVVTYPVIKMETSDYKIILDTVNARGLNTYYATDEAEDYYGASVKYSNFSVGAGKFNAKFATADVAIKEALATVLLPTVMDTASVGDTVKVQYAMYGGDSNSGEMTFVCVQENPLVFLFPGEELDVTAPAWADNYPYATNATVSSLDFYFKASETAVAYGAIYDALPTTTPTKEEIMARVQAQDMAGVFSVTTDESSITIDDLESETIYYIYAFLKDAADNESDVIMFKDTTLEGSGVVVFSGEDFQNLADGTYVREGFLNEVLSGETQGWTVASYDGNSYAQFSSYKGTGEDSVRLVTPNIDLTVATDVSFTFDINTGYYNAPCLQVLLSSDYDGSDAAAATWVDVTDNFTIPSENTNGYGAFVNAGSLSLDGYDHVAISFVYVGNGTDSRTTTIQIDDIAISGKMKEYTEITGFEKLEPIVIDTDLHLLTFDAFVKSGLLPDSVTATTVDGSKMLAVKEWMPIKGKVFDLVGLDTLAAYAELPAGYVYNGEPIVEQAVNFSVTQTLVVEDDINISFTDDMGGCEVLQVSGQTGWLLDSYGYAKINTHENGVNESWLLTPAVNVDGLSNPQFKFDMSSYNANKKISECGAGQFEVYYSATAMPGAIDMSEWTRFTTVDDVTLGDKWSFVTVDVDITNVSGTQVFFAFRHVSDDTNGTTWEVDNIVVGEKPSALNNVSELDLAVYPNPAASTISLTKNVDAVEVYSLAGKVMLQSLAVEANTTVDVSTLEAGIYMVKVTVDGQSAISKLIKK